MIVRVRATKTGAVAETQDGAKCTLPLTRPLKARLGKEGEAFFHARFEALHPTDPSRGCVLDLTDRIPAPASWR